VIHPFLLAFFPILALFARNSVQVPYGDLPLPVATALAVAGVVWLLAAAILRDWPGPGSSRRWRSSRSTTPIGSPRRSTGGCGI
jgi:hypothetical protein